MSFKLRDKAKSWFANVRDKNTISTDFDVYYLCLMMGLAASRKGDLLNEDGKQATEFAKGFIEDYRATKKVIIALLLITELKKLGLELSEKEDVQRVILEFVSPDSQTNMTEAGMKAMNKYASGGYDYLAEKLDSKPYHAEEFLRTYYRLLSDTVEGNKAWQDFLGGSWGN